MDNPLLHIAPRDRWDAARTAHEPYTDPSLEAEGFIHLSTAAQVLIPANERFAGRTNLVLLIIDPARLTAEVIFEDCYESGTEFPHLYGPLPLDAVTNVVDFVPQRDGTFELPAGI